MSEATALTTTASDPRASMAEVLLAANHKLEFAARGRVATKPSFVWVTSVESGRR